MKKIDKEIQTLLTSAEGDCRKLLEDNHRLDYLYALSDQRQMLLEWYPFDPQASLLQVGADYGAMTGLYCRKVSQVTVLDEDELAFKTVAVRYPETKNLSCVQNTLTVYADQAETQYDYVVMAGQDQVINDETVQAAKKLLKKDGILILAVPNLLGMKYWAGTAREEHSLSKKGLLQLLNPADAAARFYYPMPDYRTPITVYSDEYLPKKGDLTRVMSAYDYPEYHAMDAGEGFDVVCEEGVFDQYANSYLVFWSAAPEKLHPSEDRIFIKYNKTRRDQFQIRTSIAVKNGRRFVEKSALDPAGEEHIASFKKKYEALSGQQRVLKTIAPEYPDGSRSVVFPYLTGTTWAENLGWKLQDGAVPMEVLRHAMDQIFDLEDGARSPFAVTEAFTEIFGTDEDAQKVLANDSSCRVSNIDALFENIMETEDGAWFIDYEWVFDCPVPEHFVKYRILYYFYEQYGSLMKNTSRASVLEAFGITQEMTAVYEEMEKHFQEYVHGENQKLYLGNYMYASKGPEQMYQMEKDLNRAKERIEQMKYRMHEKDMEVRKITEVQRLTNNHVTNLEIIIGNLRHEIDEMGKTLTYLNRHEALIFKLRRKLGNKFNEKYPKGSLERKKLRYKKEMLLHPIRSFRFYSTAEGQNLKKGDFEIGDVYREHGKLHFTQVEQPKVSIVIPVYNQIHYTYACLVSILEFTKDVTYEVIIADDVSTDATEHLSEFAEGLVICRNSTNQGFLRNCNNAAQHARGEYVMFLNNDTKVTEGWLSSLVKLIESDDTIGMVGSKLVYPDGRLQEAGGIIWSDGSGWNYGRLDDPDKPEYNYVKDVDYISGAAILLSTKLWKQIGGFDDRFAPAYCEDSDLAFEVRKAGYRVVYQPLSKVIHFEGVSNGTDVQGTGLKRYQVENSKKLKEKWAEEFAKQSENTGNPDPFRARERSQGKPMILVVDHYVPTWDKDAGSKTTYQYLKMFIKKGYVVKFLGDNFLHDEPYSTELQQMGIEILYGAEYQTKIWDWLHDHGDDIEFAYLNRPHIASKYIDYILDNTEIKVIYYGHDLHFLREGREYQLTGDPKKLADSEYWKSVELSLMSKAAISYYPSYIERDAIHEIDPKLPVKDITAYVFDTFKSDIEEDFAKREGLLFVGGFAHPPNADAVLWFAREIYPRIREKMQAAGAEPPKFYVVGSKVTDEIKALEQPGNGIIIKGFVSEEELDRLYAQSRVVVVPLRYGAGVKGKVVEAIYNGAPIVTTSIGAEGIPQVEDVLLVEDDPEKFAQTTVDLYQDEAACRDLSRKTQSYIRSHFSVDAAWSVIEEDFKR
jgi:GT2 family glycosyltransferase/SAM-dependent methyltransferase